MTGRLLRGCLIAALSVIAGSTGLPRIAAAVTLTVGKASPNADPIIPVNVGDTLGIFKKHGLDLKIVDFTGGSKMAQAMAAGALDIGDGAGTEMALVAKGAPMIGVCESTGPLPFLGIGVPIEFADPLDRAAQRQEHRCFERGLADRLAGQGAGAHAGLGPAGGQRGCNR